MAGETNYEGAAPRFKGAVHTVPLIRRVWNRGKGWSSTAYHTGKIDVLKGKLPSLTTYCSQITIEEGGGPYPKMEATWNGYAEGQVEDIDLTPKWGLHSQQIDTDLLDHPSIQAVEDSFAGAIQAIRTALRDYKSKTSTLTSAQLPYRSPLISNKVSNPGMQATAYAFFDRLADGETTYRVYQPIVSRTLIVSEQYSNYGIANADPPIYTSTAIFAAWVGAPPTIVSALKEGEWLETPPEVTPAAFGKYQVQQVWEYYSFTDELLYTNRISAGPV